MKMDRIFRKNSINLIFTIILSSLSTITMISAEIWQGEFGKDVYIEATTEGLEAVHLKCYEDKMEVMIELEQPRFDGLIYTRGSYKMGKRPCFYDAQGLEKEDLNLAWSFNECKTEKRASVSGNNKYSNEIIVQFEKMLIFPGDMGFEVICEGQKATIGLADPDPGAKPLPKKRRRPVTSDTGFVTFKAKPEPKIETKQEL